MTVPSVNCEAKKLAYRQTKDGLVVSFLIHPSDMPDTLAVAPLGQRYMLVLAMIGDDELPVEPPSRRDAPFPSVAERPGAEPSSPTARARASELAKARYAAMPPMEQARERARILARDERFRAWAAPAHGEDGEVYTEETAAAYIRATCCGGQSRGLIAEDPESYRKFLALETMFRLAVGELPEIRS